MSTMASQITGVSIVCTTVGSSQTDQRKHQSSASLAFVREFTGDRWIPGQRPVTRIMFLFDDVIIVLHRGVAKQNTSVHIMVNFFSVYSFYLINFTMYVSPFYVQPPTPLLYFTCITDLIYKSHNAPVPYPTMHDSEQKYTHFWMVHRGIWNGCIMGFVRLVYYGWAVADCR